MAGWMETGNQVSRKFYGSIQGRLMEKVAWESWSELCFPGKLSGRRAVQRVIFQVRMERLTREPWLQRWMQVSHILRQGKMGKKKKKSGYSTAFRGQLKKNKVPGESNQVKESKNRQKRELIH